MSDISLYPTEDDLAAVRARLQKARGKQFWRSLDELADTPAFHELLSREFPQGAAELNDSLSRRTFLKLMGASLALAGLSGCTAAIKQPQEKVAPFTRIPITQTPGIPIYYATALSLDGFGIGVAVKNNDGRPTKVEGNPNHPASLGATDIFAQAEILSLYDPERPETVLNRGAISTWDLLVQDLNSVVQVQRALNGQGLRILTPTITSPTLAAQLDEFLTTFPSARWIQYDPVGRSNTYEGTRLAFGEPLEPRYNFENVDVVLSLDADFVAEGPGRVRYARDFMRRRTIRSGDAEMNRLYIVEPVLSNTGIVSDHRLRLKAGAVAGFAGALAAGLGVAGASADTAGLPETAAPFLAAAISDLQAAGARALVLAGEAQPPVVHALAHAINVALGAVGSTVEYTDPVAARPGDQTVALRELVSDLNAGSVEVLVVIDSNPAHTAPADLAFADAMAKAKLKVVLSPYDDETAVLADWFVPMAHALESWGDVRAYDGTASIVQPLILPLYGGRAPHELLGALLGQAATTDYDSVRTYWTNQSGLADQAFDDFFNTALSDGLIADSRLPARSVSLASGVSFDIPAIPAEGLELNFRPDPSIWDGRYANNGWLQELPKPTTKLTWDNAALMSPSTAIRLLNLENDTRLNPAQLNSTDEFEREQALERLTNINNSVVELVYQGRTLRMPVWIVPGHADDTVTLNLGYGHTQGGTGAKGTGFNTYSLRTSDTPWFGSGLEVRPTDEVYQLVSTQDHWTLEGRDIVRVGELEKFRANPNYLQEEAAVERFGQPEVNHQSLMPGFDYSKGNQWGMVIDLTTCIGCNACVIACQAENNIPVIGKDQVSRGREMHWIRIDRYFAGANFDNPQTYVMPMTCQQCEQAPCELVCPVAATVHDAEGLNNMVYNRCVGTKYCSNNCPYKVRRFNFYQYSNLEEASLKLMRNPQVTVRNRGVMEKCTFCVQRISAARIRSKVENNRPIADGEVVTACQQVCPTQAITFGNINDQNSQVTAARQAPQRYTLLDELNTLPRVTYLARLSNPIAALNEGSEG